MTGPARGWCCGIGVARPPHHVEELYEGETPVPLCPLCALAWLRQEGSGHGS
jgi:hypothetical protein